MFISFVIIYTNILSKKELFDGIYKKIRYIRKNSKWRKIKFTFKVWRIDPIDYKILELKSLTMSKICKYLWKIVHVEEKDFDRTLYK